MKNKTEQQFYAARELSNHLHFFEDGLFLIGQRAQALNDDELFDEAKSIMAKITNLQERFVDFECDILKNKKLDKEELDNIVADMKWWFDETVGFLDEHEAE